MIKVEDDIIYINGIKQLCMNHFGLYKDTPVYCNIKCKNVRVEDDYVYICDNVKRLKKKVEVVIL